MPRLKISDAPLLGSIVGDEKIPTGKYGDYTLTPDMIVSFAQGKLPFVTQVELAQVKIQLEDSINTVQTTLSADIDVLSGKVDGMESQVLGVTQDLTIHKTDYNNPHQVTKAQVGLGNVDNTSDANKPISTATQTALNQKISSVNGKTGNSITLTRDDVGVPTDDQIKAFTKEAKYVIDESGKTQQEVNNNLAKNNVNIDMFKTASNTDADAMYSMFAYAKANNIKKLFVNRDIVLDRKITLDQDETGYLNNIELIFNGNAHYVGAGANSLYIGIFELNGTLTNVTTQAVGDHVEYTSDINVVDGSIFSIGDYILVRSTSTSKPDVYLNHIVRIDNIVGNTLKTDTIRRLAVRPSVAQVNIIKVNTINGLNILGNPMFTAENQTTRTNGIGAIQLRYCVNNNINISCKGLWFKGVATNQCSRVTVSCQGFDAAATDGGEGYSVQFQYTTHSTIEKTIGHNMRHITDMTCSWWCRVIDCTDNDATNTAYNHHCAYEYGIDYIRCNSFNSREHGFNLGVVNGDFGDNSGNINLIDCKVLNAASAGVMFANKDKGLNINGGYFSKSPSSLLYSVITSNNDTTINNCQLPTGIQVTTSPEMNTSGFTTLNNCNVNEGVNSRSINITANRKLKVSGGSVMGRHLLYANSRLELNNVDLTHFKTGQTFTRVSNGANISIIINGGNLKYEDDSTVSQTIDVDTIELDNVNLTQTQTNRVTSLNCRSVQIKNVKGVTALSSDGSINVSFNIQNCVGLSNVANINLLSVSNFKGLIAAQNNTLTGNIAINSAVSTGTVSIQGNTITGSVSCTNSIVAKAIVLGNIISAASTLPTNDGTSKIVKDNIIG